LNLGNDAKIKGGWTKFLLRKSMEKILPKEIVWRKDKKGFVTPGEVLWLRGALQPYTLLNYKILAPFLNVEKTQKVMEEYHLGSNKNAKLVWRLAMLNYWIEKNSLS
jgi:asparagine synthase (glutamine-hydrolysing)